MSQSHGVAGWVLVCSALAASLATAGQPPKGKPKAPAEKVPPKPALHTVTRGTFTVEVKLKGVFEAKQMAEVAFRPEAWGELFVEKAVEAGTRVKKGDLVLTLDARKIDEAIRDKEEGRALSNLAVRLMERDVRALEQSLPLDLAAAKRAKQIADEDLARYEKTDRPLSVEQARFSVKRARDYLAYQKEELRQLEKMYQADDLTEETEEIVLKRQRDAVERLTFALKVAEIKAENTLEVDLPRRDVSVKENARRQAIALEKARAALPMTLQKMRLELEKHKRAQRKAADQLAKLKKDRQAMAVRAPIDGVVYYGPCVRGEWPKLTRSLDRGTKVAPHEVVMTLVVPDAPFVRATVAEKELHRLKPGMKGEAVPVGYPELKLKATLEAFTPCPVGAGQFGARIAIDRPKTAAHLMPGMNCGVTLVADRKTDVLTVPASAVFTDEGDKAKTFVYLRKKDGSPAKHFVTVGKRTDKEAVVRRGLKEGDVVFLQKPEKAK